MKKYYKCPECNFTTKIHHEKNLDICPCESGCIMSECVDEIKPSATRIVDNEFFSDGC